MYALDFEYDGRRLSDYNFMICNFGDGEDTATAGSKITFETVPVHDGKRYLLSHTKYDEYIETTFTICKNPCYYDDLVITNAEYRDIMRWLNRRNFYRFQLFDQYDQYRESCWYEASFNIEKYMSEGKLVGLILTLTTNTPFGYGQDQTVTWNITDTGTPKILSNISDEIGYIYPSMKITLRSSGNLRIYNDLEDCEMIIKNCSSGEVITIDGMTHIIQSSNSSHKIYNDFNFVYLRIANTLNNRNNRITVSLPCLFELTYTPIIKDAPD